MNNIKRDIQISLIILTQHTHQNNFLLLINNQINKLINKMIILIKIFNPIKDFFLKTSN